MEKNDKINFRGRRLENNQNLRQNEAVSKLRSHARTQEESVVEYSPINQFVNGFSPSMAVNSQYLNDNVEGRQFYFSFGSFPAERSVNLGLKSRFNF